MTFTIGNTISHMYASNLHTCVDSEDGTVKVMFVLAISYFRRQLIKGSSSSVCVCVRAHVCVRACVYVCVWYKIYFFIVANPQI